ncbi:hypothetical protein ELQ90_16325 [Labedella phragmitis]|uniref:Uncharacterized protein n=1 Tax=Labedella phragmitis TaxID=2498849 RepID=A0A444PNQ2_9MICO|nr:hypothetical protein [Labedella phragmitis]RWZ46051.1 hypothetical protein ELQ90_16325 [Labedella phragmitis]
MAHSFARIIIVREGEADWIGEHHSQHVTLGDVLVIGANTRCGATLDYAMTATTMYLNDDFLTDQIFWQFAASFTDRRDVRHNLKTHYEPAQVLRIGVDAVRNLAPLLDEFVAIGADGGSSGSSKWTSQ